jgi:hypothetical protein
MTQPHLRPCPGCSRHARVSEAACPFCGAALDSSFRAAPAPVRPAARLSRAALFALATGTAVLTPVLATDCSNGADENVVPFYGAAALLDGGEQDSALGSPDVHVGSADAGDSSLADAGSDAGADGGSPDGATDSGRTD